MRLSESDQAVETHEALWVARVPRFKHYNAGLSVLLQSLDCIELLSDERISRFPRRMRAFRRRGGLSIGFSTVQSASRAVHYDPEGTVEQAPHRTAITALNQILPSSPTVNVKALSPFVLAPRIGKRMRIAKNLRSGFDLDADLDRFVDDVNFHGDW
jgi:hypothetical protein